MPKHVSIPSTKVDQRLLMIRSFSFLMIGLFCMYIGVGILPSYVATFSSKIARIPDLNGDIICLIIILCFLAMSIIKNSLIISTYHFELHSDALIIVRRKLLKRKILFFNLKDISTISFGKILAFPKEPQSQFNYELNTLTIQQDQKKPTQLSFSASYHELKALKEFLKDFL